MKRFVVILLIVVLLLGCGVGYLVARDGEKDPGEPVALYDPENIAEPELPEESEEPESTEALLPARTIDYAAIRALYPMDEVIGDVDGRDVTWEEYFYWLGDMGTQAQSYIEMLAMYGQKLDWEDKYSSESEDSFAQYVVQMAQDCVRQMSVVEAVAEENGVSLTEADEAEIAETHRQNIAAICGEDASEEDFNTYLEENFVTRGIYDRLNALNYLFKNTNTALFGERGAAISEEDAIAYLEEQGYLSAAHILFLTVDMETYEDGAYKPLDEAVVAEKLKQAEAVSAELRAIADPAERAARFAELKEQYCEDKRSFAYPDGYLFVPGSLNAEFEDGAKALEEYEVSEPILSPLGYHVIMRLPLSADMTIRYDDSNEPVSARSILADTRYSELMSGRIESSVLTLRDDVAAFDLTKYLIDAE